MNLERIAPGTGFTLLELVVVIVILGILVSLALPMYQDLLEKERTAEAKQMLKVLQKAELAYYLEKGIYGLCQSSSINDLMVDMPIPCTQSGYNCTIPQQSISFFNYRCMSDGNCYAFRCTQGGKFPPSATQYYLMISSSGSRTCSPPASDACKKYGW